MVYSKSVETLIVLSALAGFVHVLAPDHWVPSSVIAWQRGWRPLRSVFFGFFALSLHLLAGFVVFWGASDYLALIPARKLMSFAVLLVVFMCFARSLRFSKIRDVLRFGPSSTWGIFAALSLLGPCEYLLPILMKSRQMGAGYLIPLSAFGLGTLLSGVSLIASGPLLWNRPQLLPLSLQYANQRISVVPAAATVLAGLAFFFRGI